MSLTARQGRTALAAGYEGREPHRARERGWYCWVSGRYCDSVLEKVRNGGLLGQIRAHTFILQRPVRPKVVTYRHQTCYLSFFLVSLVRFSTVNLVINWKELTEESMASLVSCPLSSFGGNLPRECTSLTSSIPYTFHFFNFLKSCNKLL